MDVVTLGESMVTFLPGRPGRLADVPSFDRAIGGAESNVACALAAFGHTARWVSRVGADGFGDHLVERIAGYGVDVSAVRRDPDRPTGVYFRTAGDRGTGAHEVAYYRAGSAASAMSTRNVDLAAVRAARVLHLSGITAALSDTCLDLLRALTAPGPDRPLISFDVNHRPGLWRTAEGPRVLLEVARHADVVFVGEDEAEQAWGVTGGPEAIRGVLPEPGVVVVKQGERGATAFAGPGRSAGADRDRATASRPSAPPPSGPPLTAASPAAHPLTAAPPTETSSAAPPPPETSPSALPPSAPPLTAAPHAFEPALRTAVVATTGAGDAFAAGFLSATLRGLPLGTRLRHGHLFAAAALTAPGDLAPPPARDHADRLAALDAGAWGRLRLGPGWTQADRATEEANNP
ncbi:MULTISPECIES: sugar kinase [Streptomyces]|uniref:sugar kinase n=1 Tax=Streptomyces TaxID=1883 RepID=UPI000B9691BC|nr:sugar kinase [Streptomyces sp. FBKL.4005]OYP15646.1 carbohydrate kinase [Streptomyces sp. FBKL.4005]